MNKHYPFFPSGAPAWHFSLGAPPAAQTKANDLRRLRAQLRLVNSRARKTGITTARRLIHEEQARALRQRIDELEAA